MSAFPCLFGNTGITKIRENDTIPVSLPLVIELFLIRLQPQFARWPQNLHAPTLKVRIHCQGAHRGFFAQFVAPVHKAQPRLDPL